MRLFISSRLIDVIVVFFSLSVLRFFKKELKKHTANDSIIAGVQKLLRGQEQESCILNYYLKVPLVFYTTNSDMHNIEL
jgi:hypothetical protein